MTLPDWPAAMGKALAAKYLSLSIAGFEREVLTGRLPQPTVLDGKERFLRAVAPMLIAHGRELEKAEVVEWLLEDADKTEQEAARIVANTTGNPRKNAAEWKLLVSLKRGIATAIRARQTQEANHDF